MNGVQGLTTETRCRTTGTSLTPTLSRKEWVWGQNLDLSTYEER